MKNAEFNAAFKNVEKLHKSSPKEVMSLKRW